MKFVNLTPHYVVVKNGALQVRFEKEAGSPIARLDITTEEKNINYEVAPGIKISVPVSVASGYEVKHLPDPQPGVVYIVSTMVANFVKRPDVIAPLTDATCERDGSGRITSVKGFQTFANSTTVFKSLREIASSK